MLPNRSHWKILQRTEDGHGDTGTERAILAADTGNGNYVGIAYSRITIIGKAPYTFICSDTELFCRQIYE
jgi:hypothetical protein